MYKYFNNFIKYNIPKTIPKCLRNEKLLLKFYTQYIYIL